MKRTFNIIRKVTLVISYKFTNSTKNNNIVKVKIIFCERYIKWLFLLTFHNIIAIKKVICTINTYFEV